MSFEVFRLTVCLYRVFLEFVHLTDKIQRKCVILKFTLSIVRRAITLEKEIKELPWKCEAKINKEIRRCTFCFGKIGRVITIWVAIKKSNIA